jgi:hypothetical protein
MGRGMKFSTKEDINAPIDEVFEILADFDAYERNAMRRGADVRRVDTLGKVAPGMRWKAVFPMRGKMRDLDLTLTEFDRPNTILIFSETPGIEGTLSMELVAMSRTRTRLSVALDLKPQNLSARLLIQSLRLAKSNLTTRFKQRVADYAKDMESRCSAAAQTH